MLLGDILLPSVNALYSKIHFGGPVWGSAKTALRL